MTTAPAPTAHGSRPRLASCAAVLLALASFGCSEDSPQEGATGAQPDVLTEEFQSDELSGIPIPGAAEPVSAPAATDGTVAQSFEIPGRTPEQVLREMRSNLEADGWETAVTPEQVGTGYQGEWLRDGQVLEVSATPFGAAEGDAVVTQFSLVLRTGG